MPIAYDGKVYEDEAALEADTNPNVPDSLKNLYYTPPPMPPQAPTEAAGALESSGSTGTPDEGVKPKSDVVYPEPYGLNPPEGLPSFRPRLSSMVAGAVHALALPGDVLSGKVEPGSVQEIERAADLAGLVVGGPAPVAAKLADGSLGSFAGVRSLSKPDAATAVLKERLYQAQNKELDSVHPDTIWQETGFFRGADNRWRYEIPDKDANLKMDAFNKTTTITDNSTGWTNTKLHGEVTETIVPKKFRNEQDFFDSIVGGKPSQPLTLDKVIDHPELFKAYPELKTMKVEPLPEYLKDSGIKGQVSGDTIYLAEGHPEYIKSVLLHEIQHSIQHHEGFAFGGNQQQFLPKELPRAEKEFLAIKKEIEPKVEESLKHSGLSLNQWKQTVSEEQLASSPKDIPETYKIRLSVLKEKYPLEYKRLSKIVESERLIQEAKVGAFVKYQRLMGEVEARNVQTRMDYDIMRRQFETPMKTEDVHRSNQLNPKNSSGSAATSSEPIPFRRGANDNEAPLNTEPLTKALRDHFHENVTKPHDEFIKKYDELHGAGILMGKNKYDEVSVARYNKLGKELAEITGEPWEEFVPIDLRPK